MKFLVLTLLLLPGVVLAEEQPKIGDWASFNFEKFNRECKKIKSAKVEREVTSVYVKGGEYFEVVDYTYYWSTGHKELRRFDHPVGVSGRLLKDYEKLEKACQGFGSMGKISVPAGTFDAKCYM